MRAELEKKLIEDFPVFFGGHTLPPTQSLMCFGCECDDGWEPLVRSVAEVAEKWNKEHPDKPVVAMQIKEKYGGLRVYTNACEEEVDKAIEKAESLSYETCEDCGGKGKVWDGGWVYTRCDACMEKLKHQKLVL